MLKRLSIWKEVLANGREVQGSLRKDPRAWLRSESGYVSNNCEGCNVPCYSSACPAIGVFEVKVKMSSSLLEEYSSVAFLIDEITRKTAEFHELFADSNCI